MSKIKSVYSCQSCGAQFPKWAGQCGDCGAWNTLQETRPDTTTPRMKASSGYAGQAAQVTVLDEVSVNSENRTPTGLSELDRVLGGGLVEGSVVLIGGIHTPVNFGITQLLGQTLARRLFRSRGRC